MQQGQKAKGKVAFNTQKQSLLFSWLVFYLPRQQATVFYFV
jgi:hypothetical protein